MNMFAKHITAACVAACFLAASLYCCCFSTIQLSKKKHSCCPTKESQGQKAAKHDCLHCNSSFNAELSVQNVQEVVFAPVALTSAVDQQVAHTPVIIGKSLFINGPPGPMHVVPLYIKFPSLRL